MVSFLKSVLPYTSTSAACLSSWALHWKQRMLFLKEMYPRTVLFSIPICYLLALLDKKEGNITSTALMFLILLTYFTYFLPPYTQRVLTYMNIFVILSFSYLLLTVSEIVLKSALKTRSNFALRSKTPLLYAIISILLLFSLTSADICMHTIEAFNKSTMNKEYQSWLTFEMGKFLRANVRGDNPVVLTSASKWEWYYRGAAFYAGIGILNLWEDDVLRFDLLREIYLAETSEDAYLRIRKLLRERRYLVLARDPHGEEIRRFGDDPSDVILLYNDRFASWLGDPNSVFKFFDVRYFEPLLIAEQRVEGIRFYVFRVRSKPEPVHPLFSSSFEHWNEEECAPEAWRPLNPGLHWKGMLDSCEVVNGSYSYKIECRDGDAAIASIPLRVIPNRFYLLKFWMKAENTNYVDVYLAYFDELEGRWKGAGDMLLSHGCVPSKWKAYYILTLIPGSGDVKEAVIVLKAGGPYSTNKKNAVIWFDHLELIGPIEVTRISIEHYGEMGLPLCPTLRYTLVATAVILPMLLISVNIIRRWPVK